MGLNIEQVKILLADQSIDLRAAQLELEQSQTVVAQLREEIRRLQEEKEEKKKGE